MPSGALAGVPFAPGMPAPDFALPGGPDTTLSLQGLRGKSVVPLFFPATSSPVWRNRVVQLGKCQAAFAQRDATLVGVSVDGVSSHAALAEARGIPFPLLADFEPKGAFARACGVYREGDGFNDRSLFIPDGEGVVRWREVVQPWEDSGADGVLVALDALGPAAATATEEEPR